ncbi:MAG: UDP-2,4-diacetamido-2,4,6-trideoxy-beta-L-altropyranose hydrolase [Candidatus Omnitrophica bacterium]|nr:UDP-2,4-diacetamido-2,4,6-trideoxy-beta-L-altropyranose hydrolase [Candidatus Omnitrophota bacterium]
MAVVLFRTDAAPAVGLGHLRRCLSLAAALQRQDVRSVFVVPEDRQVRRCVREAGCSIEIVERVTAGDAVDLQHVLRAASRSEAAAVIVDSYQIGADYLEALRQAGLYVAVIDDLAAMAFPCHVVVNGGPHACRLPYRSSSGETTFLLGPSYALLGPAFWNVGPRPVRQTVQHVLLTLGGADPHHLMPRLLGLLDDLPGEFGVTAVIGPFFQNRLEVQHVAKRCQRTVRLVDAPASLRDLMLEADLAVSAGGQTLFELARVGCPAVAVRTASNQVAQLRAFVESGAMRLAGDAGDAHVMAAVRDSVASLVGDQGERGRMSLAGRRLVDGRGAQRTADAIAAGIRTRLAAAIKRNEVEHRLEGRMVSPVFRTA